MKHNGLQLHRLGDNPMEKAFHDAWLAENPVDRGDSLLAHLLGDGEKLAEISERDVQVAATVIQWLGSQVGQHFVRTVMEQAKAA